MPDISLKVANDQAAGLRQLVGVRALRVIPILSNQRDNGSDAAIAHLAAALQRIGKQVLVIDADRSLVGAWLGLKLRHELREWLTGECAAEQIAVQSREGFWVMTGTNGFLQLKGNPDARQTLKRLAVELSCMARFDTCLVTAPIETLQLILGEQLHEVWMITATDPAAVRASYRRIKTVITQHALNNFRMIYTNAPDASQCEQAHQSLSQTINQFTGAGLYFGGAIAAEPKLIRAQREQQTLVSLAPNDPVALSFEQMALSMTKRNLGEWPVLVPPLTALAA